MSESKVLFVDANKENHFPQIFPQLPIIKSDRITWTGISLEYHRQPPFETSEYAIGSHMIAINLGQSFQMERKIDRSWETSQVLPGAIGLCPFNISHELRWHSEMNWTGTQSRSAIRWRGQPPLCRDNGQCPCRTFIAALFDARAS
jgi:hypothetical protein